MGLFSNRSKTHFTNEKADAIAGMVAAFHKASVSAIESEKLTQADLDVVYMFSFGGIDYLAQSGDMGDTDSVAKTTLLFLAKHLGMERDTAIKQMQFMVQSSESTAGLEIMKQGGNALKRFMDEDMSAAFVLNDLITGRYFS